MKIAITGGHLTPALAFIDHLQKQHPYEEIIFIGRKFSQEKKQLAKEEREIKKRQLKFFTIDTPKFQSHQILKSISKLPQLIQAIKQSRFILKENQIEVFLGFGGYLSLPVAIAAKTLSIPIIIHEQTTSLGLANSTIGHFAKYIALSQKMGNKQSYKYRITGNPIRKSLTEKAKKPKWVNFSQKRPLLYVTGGNQGSKTINQLIWTTLPELTQNFNVIHQTGKNNKPHIKYKNYLSYQWISETELAWILQNTSLAFSRAGANSVQELAFFTIPTLFIPLPTARNNEQLTNAKQLEKIGGALILDQASANKQTFLKSIKKLQESQAEIKKVLSHYKSDIPLQASEKIYQLLKQINE